MSNTRTYRPVPLALSALVAAFSAAAALAVTDGNDAHAHSHAHAVAASSAMSAKEVALRGDMRRLWEDHIAWTRLAIISLTTDSPDTQATVGRLLRNQADIGDAVKPFYGKAAGNKLTLELRRHILIAADVIAAAKEGDQAALAREQARWQRNANVIAAVLNSVNPRFWKLSAMKAEMQKHLALTTQEVVARLQRKWNADVAVYDRIHSHILHLADALSAGLVSQFPERFR
jgi:hypothetical protein